MNKIIPFILIFFLNACKENPEEPVKEIQPSKNWTFTLGDITIIPNKLDVPIYPWFPDGHIAIVNDPNADAGYRYIMFWSEFKNYRSVGPTPFPEDQLLLDPKTPVFGERGDWQGYNNGGSWLNSVFRQSETQLIGFYHAEDHWYPRNKDYIAWKSTGVATSNDNGRSWTDHGQVITSSTPKPASPKWGGSGDCCVIWHENDNRWICYYQNQNIRMAISDDPDANPGSWFKFYNGGFPEMALGGKSTPLAGLSDVPGSNPSVHFNTFLKLWIMVYHGWSPACLYIASSVDGYNWSKPQQLVCGSQGGRAWYPTIIGESDVSAGEKARLYYADFSADGGSRDFIVREIRFVRND
ncbi:hypothetical protein JW935_26685 [candidate division KSB1 bacterium]|nr:hypothetical protein [candidate division KSB1 bacterium]